ncbi:MAG: hypothetical protein H8E44_45815 [Planctomycetes bacterium]|nr:hypothetical protein [Planctomycetota bacterium]MBL7040287.1 hypothetical protein [Pirellulaceae bacterium]
MTLRFTSGKQQFRIWIVPTDDTPTDVMVAEGPTNRPDARMPMLILRRTATRTRFVTVLEPVQEVESLQAVRADTGADGNRISLVLEWPTGSDRLTLR